MTIELPRLMLAAPSSGSGKTTVTIALLQALKNRGRRPAAFKCGPDYIDPMFHREVLGLPGYNLDLFFTPPHVVRGLLAQGAEGAELAVLEGVMGYYDGAGLTEEASSYHLACETGTPTVLVVRPGGASLSVAALVSGFLRFRGESRVGGVLLNECAPSLGDRLAGIIERECGVPVYGALPKLPHLALESRHLGLVTPDGVSGLREKAEELAHTLEEHSDLDALLTLAGSAPRLEGKLPELSPIARGVPIAVARDEAFCFYYQENLDLLQKLGAELVFFSPLRDGGLPQGVCGLYLGGGYPELHAKALAENAGMREAVRRAVGAGLPTVAECGGFLYLQRELEDGAGGRYPMAGALDGVGYPAGKLGRFGYIELTARTGGLLCPEGETIRGHEFHYWDSSHPGEAFQAQKPHSGLGWRCAHTGPGLYTGFPHLYFWSNPAAAARFVAAAQRQGETDRPREGRGMR